MFCGKKLGHEKTHLDLKNCINIGLFCKQAVVLISGALLIKPNMLESVCHFILISGVRWNLLVKMQFRFLLDLERTEDHLKKKFSKVHQTKVPTKNPIIRSYIIRAKAIQSIIIQKITMQSDPSSFKSMRD